MALKIKKLSIPLIYFLDSKFFDEEVEYFIENSLKNNGSLMLKFSNLENDIIKFQKDIYIIMHYLILKIPYSIALYLLWMQLLQENWQSA